MNASLLLLLLLRKVDSGLLATVASVTAVPCGGAVAARRCGPVGVVGPTGAAAISIGSPVPAGRTVSR